ncbi:MAG: 16S rRNA (uracil(1498)-N(3))-methyltransferase, partial [Oscillospiraceae bacterium]|nr:16S rRNA (uracil(1498)-N(3))-methyltransferase [Oscillospiraceae bacterium]
EEEEVSQAQEIGAKPITLGRRILRTETAGLAVLAMLVLLLEE